MSEELIQAVERYEAAAARVRRLWSDVDVRKLKPFALRLCDADSRELGIAEAILKAKLHALGTDFVHQGVRYKARGGELLVEPASPARKADGPAMAPSPRVG